MLVDFSTLVSSPHHLCCDPVPISVHWKKGENQPLHIATFSSIVVPQQQLIHSLGLRAYWPFGSISIFYFVFFRWLCWDSTGNKLHSRRLPFDIGSLFCSRIPSHHSFTSHLFFETLVDWGHLLIVSPSCRSRIGTQSTRRRPLRRTPPTHNKLGGRLRLQISFQLSTTLINLEHLTLLMLARHWW